MLFAQMMPVLPETQTPTGDLAWELKFGLAGVVGSILGGILLFVAKKYDSTRDEQIRELKEANKELLRENRELTKELYMRLSGSKERDKS
jgi:hypothetical protein